MLTGICALALASHLMDPTVLVFSKTSGYRHDCIETGVQMVRDLGQSNGFAVEHTEDAARFTDQGLSKYSVVVFECTTMDVLNFEQQEAFKRWFRRGHGYVGIHAAADTEYDWRWYGQMVGAYFKSHPRIQKATVNVLDQNHPSTQHLNTTWIHTDEWYNYKSLPYAGCTILMKLDESSYEGGDMQGNHPISWCHDYDGGRSFYTGLGHTKETYALPEYRKHILGAIKWAGRL